VNMNPAGIWQFNSVLAHPIAKVVAVASEVMTDPTIACDEKPARKISVVTGSAAFAAATQSATVVKSVFFNIFNRFLPFVP